MMRRRGPLPGQHHWPRSRDADGWQACQREGCTASHRNGRYRVVGYSPQLRRAPACPTTADKLRAACDWDGIGRCPRCGGEHGRVL